MLGLALASASASRTPRPIPTRRLFVTAATAIVLLSSARSPWTSALPTPAAGFSTRAREPCEGQGGNQAGRMAAQPQTAAHARRRVTARELTAFVPSLDPSLYKGQAGKIGVIGGSRDYTGAPYYAGITALRVGADLVHVFTVESAALAIKTYSPDLMVHPSLPEPRPDRELWSDGSEVDADGSLLEDLMEWVRKLDALVIGPGLGRADDTLDFVARVVSAAKDSEVAMVVDADGLMLVKRDPGIFTGYQRALLTPNIMEATRLHKAVLPDSEQLSVAALLELPTAQLAAWVHTLAVALDGPGVLVKGATDIVGTADGVTAENSDRGSPRRCGGQGDLTAGSAGTFLNWALRAHPDDLHHALRLAGIAASTLTRACAGHAYGRLGRSMTASDMIDSVATAFDEHFES